MPRVKRRPKGRQYGRDNLRTVLRLSLGHDFGDLVPGDELPEDELADAWTELRDYITAVHVHGSEASGDWTFQARPGTRPWAWWMFDAPEPRRQIKPGPKPLGPPDWFGMPSRYDGQPPAGMYETESAYLARHGLSLPDENI